MAEIDWHQYPGTKPAREGHFLITLESASGRLVVRSAVFCFDLQCFFYDPKGDHRVKAWAELPEPFVGTITPVFSSREAKKA